MTATVLHLTLPPDLALRDRHRRTGLRLARIEHPALARILDITIVPEGLALTMDLPDDAEPLPADLSAPEVLAVLAPIATGLAHLHDAGYALGALTRRSLHRRSDGTGLIVGWVPGADPADDVAGLADLLAELLPEGSVGSDIVSIMVSGSDPEPTARPTMARMAAVLDLARRSESVARPAPERVMPLAPESPPAVRRPRSEGEALTWRGDPETPAQSSVGSAVSRSPRSHGRHAARSGRRLPLRWLAAAAGVVAVAIVGVGAVGADEAPVDTCQVGSASTAETVESDGVKQTNDANSPRPPAQSQKKSSGRSR